MFFSLRFLVVIVLRVSCCACKLPLVSLWECFASTVCNDDDDDNDDYDNVDNESDDGYDDWKVFLLATSSALLHLICYRHNVDDYDDNDDGDDDSNTNDGGGRGGDGGKNADDHEDDDDCMNNLQPCFLVISLV